MVRTLTNVNLFDVAPVDGPAYESTSVSARDLERARDEIIRSAPEGGNAGDAAESHEDHAERLANMIDEAMADDMGLTPVSKRS